MGIVEQVTGVFTDMMEWIGGSFSTIESLFYNAETGLTFWASSPSAPSV